MMEESMDFSDHDNAIVLVSDILGTERKVTARLVKFNKVDATELLKKRYSGQREIDRSDLARCEEAMNAGEYIEALLDPIHLSPEGKLMNGQHRLQAVVNTDTEHTFLVVKGLPEEVFPFMDQNNSRTIKEHLERVGVANAAEMTSTTNLLYYLMTEARRNPRPIVTERMVADHPRLETAVALAKKIKKSAHLPVRIGAALIFLYGEYAPDKADEFFELLAQGEDFEDDPSHPIAKLSGKLYKEDMAKRERRSHSIGRKLEESMMAWTHQAWTTFIANKSLYDWDPDGNHPTTVAEIAALIRRAVVLRSSHVDSHTKGVQEVS